MFIKMSQEKEDRKRQIFALVPCCLLSFCYGTNSAFVALLTAQLQEDCSEFSITTNQESWIVCLDNLFTPIVCLISGPLQHFIGPRSSLELSCLPYIAAWIITAQATDYKVLYIARLLVGISHALSSTTIYTVEILSNELRGPFDIMIASFRALGSITVFVFGLFFRWPTIANIAAGVPCLALLVSLLIPESPVYLIYNNKDKKAESSMKRLYGDNFDTQEKVENIRMNLQALASKRQGGKKRNYLRELNKHPEVYKPFGIILILSFVQMFSGATVLRGYVIKICDSLLNPTDISDKVSKYDNSSDVLMSSYNATSFEDDDSECVKVRSVSDLAYLSGIIIGIFRFVCTIYLARQLTKHRRRSMYFVSMILSCGGLLLFALFSMLSDKYSGEVYGWLSVGSACFLVGCVQLGVQNLPYLYSGELFPADIRAICKSLSRSCTTLMIMATLKLFPEAVYHLTLSGTFLLFAIVLAIFFPVMYLILPETKGRNLESMYKQFRKSTAIEDAYQQNRRRDILNGLRDDSDENDGGDEADVTDAKEVDEKIKMKKTIKFTNENIN